MANWIKIDEASKEPLYVQIREKARESIRCGTLKPGDKIPGEREISTELGVSITIVRKALSTLVDEGLIYRRPKRGTLVADTIADESLSRTRTTTVGVVVEGRDDMFMTDILKGIQDVLQVRDYQMFFCNSNCDVKSEMNHFQSLLDRNVDGFIIYPVGQKIGIPHKYSHYHTLLQNRVPFVQIDRYMKNIEADYVVFDNYGGACQAVSHLVRLGHRKIAHITLPQHNTAVVGRADGYKDALVASGIKFDQGLIGRCGFLDYALLTKIVEEFLSKNVTAILCVTDFFAANVHRILQERGIKVPQEVSLIGFSMQRALNAYYPALTAVAIPSYEMGQKAAEILLTKMENADRKTHRIVLPTELVIGTTDAPTPVR